MRHSLLGLPLWLGACAPVVDEPPALLPPPAGAPSEPPSPAAAVDPLASVPAGREPAPAAAAAPAAPEPAAGTRIKARHILIPYEGATRAPSGLRRSRAEALDRAREARARVAAGEDFAAVALQMSEDGSAAEGGALGAFGRGAMVPAFEQVAFSLAEGQLSEVVESPFGFHVIERQPLVELPLRVILIGVDGRGFDQPSRSRAEAQARLAEVEARLAAGEPFAQVARALSDGPTAPRGGALGQVEPEQLEPAVAAALAPLSPGGRTAPIETAAGYYIFAWDGAR
jgi:peptidyl-prolyl cis-trans isomerase SurA